MGFQHIAIFGLGLMGGSLAAALKRKGVSAKITGVDQPDIVERALAKGFIDLASGLESFSLAIADADLVFLAAPVQSILRLLPEVGEAVTSGTIITDIGSTKAQISRHALECLPGDVYFVGGHPMTGSEKRGLNHADALLFENAVYVLVENESVPQRRLAELADLIEGIGANIIFMSAETHDKIAAMVSHLPQLLAVTLMQHATEMNATNEAYLKLAAGGFRDMTRIASSPYAMWTDIFQTNQQNVVSAVDAFIDHLRSSRRLLIEGNLEAAFEIAARNRLAIPRDTRGFLKRHYDLSVMLEDKPGVIAAISTALAAEGLNIKDIEVLKVREGDAGTLRLALESEPDRARAQDILIHKGFQATYRD